jgi:hypothetical protein
MSHAEAMNAGSLALAGRATDDGSPARCQGAWWTRIRTRVAVPLSGVGLAVLGLIGSAPAQPLYTQVANSLRVEWQRTTSLGGRPVLEGYVYNASPYRIGGVRLRVEMLDSSNQVLGETFGWVYGNIRAGGRWPFSMPPPKEGESLRVTVESFYLIAREAPSESP